MNQWPAFDLSATLSTLASLLLAFLLGALIGFERQVRQRTAGLRTNTLVAVGAAVFVDLAVRFHALYGGSPSPLQVIAYVVSGIGFLGAGAIMKEGANVSGLNTAATLWGSAAVGCCAGAKLLPEAVLAALFVLAANTLLRPVVNRINRQPVQEELSEATYTVYVICQRAPVRGARAAGRMAGGCQLPGARHRPAPFRPGRRGDRGHALRHRRGRRRTGPDHGPPGSRGRRAAGLLERQRGGLMRHQRLPGPSGLGPQHQGPMQGWALSVADPFCATYTAPP